ncbi:MAG: outer membrane beta-barrel protein [Bacteroidota bacterium]|nr:outer membrane beta-barrel protein [Bacteroidota bacterium]
MKNAILLGFIVCSLTFTHAQYKLDKGKAQLNAGVGFSGWGIPVYIGLDYGVHKNISVGGELSFRSYSNYYRGYGYNHQIFGLSANGNYHFNSVFKIPREWDLYAGLNLGFYFWSSPNDYRSDRYDNGTGVGLGLQVGGRYYFSDKFGINLELGGGSAFSGGKFGISYAF